MGVAKLVVDAGTPEPAVKTALSVLELAVSKTCQDSVVTVLSEEVRALRRRVTELQQILPGARPRAGGPQAPGAASDADETDARGDALVDRALAHLQQHYSDRTLTLQSVARALRCNPRYLTSRFTRTAGERMHVYLITVRVSHACRLLIDTDLRVKEIAFASGFSGERRLVSAFRTHVGVSPGKYRRIFAAR